MWRKKNGYRILDATTLQKFAPIIKITLSLIRLSGTIMCYPFPTSDKIIDELDEISTKFIGDEYGQEFSDKVNDMFSSNESSLKNLNLQFDGEVKRATDKVYRQLKVLMESLDPQLQMTGLQKVEGGSDGTEKSIEWVCEMCKDGFHANGIHYKPVNAA